MAYVLDDLAKIVSGGAKGLAATTGKLLTNLDAQVHKPGVAGALADLGASISAGEPTSWQHNLGKLVAASETAKVFDKYRKNIEKIVAGGDESKGVSPTSGLADLEVRRLSPEMQMGGLESIIAGRKLQQGERGLDYEGRRVGVAEGQLDLQKQQAEIDTLFKQAQIGGIDALAALHRYQAKGGDQKYRIETIPIGDQIQTVVMDDKANIIRKLGEPAPRWQESSPESKARLRTSIVTSARSAAATDLANEGYGDVIADQYGNVIGVKFNDPEKGKELWADAYGSWIDTYAKASDIPLEEVEKLKRGDPTRNVTTDVKKSDAQSTFDRLKD